jgi:hypothetical protein
MKSICFAIILLVASSVSAASYTMSEWVKFGYQVVGTFTVKDVPEVLMQKCATFVICNRNGKGFDCEEVK